MTLLQSSARQSAAKYVNFICQVQFCAEVPFEFGRPEAISLYAQVYMHIRLDMQSLLVLNGCVISLLYSSDLNMKIGQSLACGTAINILL